MFRRTIGLAKVADIVSIEDLELRAYIETNVLSCASILIKSDLNNIHELIKIIENNKINL